MNNRSRSNSDNLAFSQRCPPKAGAGAALFVLCSPPADAEDGWLSGLTIATQGFASLVFLHDSNHILQLYPHTACLPMLPRQQECEVLLRRSQPVSQLMRCVVHVPAGVLSVLLHTSQPAMFHVGRKLDGSSAQVIAQNGTEVAEAEPSLLQLQNSVAS